MKLKSHGEVIGDEVTINSADLTAEEAAQKIILHSEQEGFIGMNRGTVREHRHLDCRIWTPLTLE